MSVVEKTKYNPHRSRILAMQAIFQSDFQSRSIEELKSFDWIDFIIPDAEKELAQKIIEITFNAKKELDEIIIRFLVNWEFDRISPVNKAILRISIAQLMFFPEIDAPIVIDEAIRLAKEYSEDDSTRFINGVIDAYYKSTLVSL